MKTLLEIINSKLNTDASPDNKAPQRLACAETVSTILKEYLAQHGIDFPIIISTYELWRYMQKRTDLFERQSEPVSPRAGDIIIWPTGTNTRPDRASNGHTGFFLNSTDIASNSSLEPNVGDFIQNYTRDTARNYFHYYAGFPAYLFRLIV